jgi:hypothetical protein
MDKKGVIVIGGISIVTIGSILLWFFVIGPALDGAINEVLKELGENSICPEEFAVDEYKICFNGQGEVIVDGIINYPNS